MSDTIWTALLVIVIVSYAFLIGMNVGIWRERRCQRYMRKSEQELKHAQEQVDLLVNEYNTVDQVQDYYRGLSN